MSSLSTGSRFSNGVYERRKNPLSKTLNMPGKRRIHVFIYIYKNFKLIAIEERNTPLSYHV